MQLKKHALIFKSKLILEAVKNYFIEYKHNIMNPTMTDTSSYVAI